MHLWRKSWKLFLFNFLFTFLDIRGQVYSSGFADIIVFQTLDKHWFIYWVFNNIKPSNQSFDIPHTHQLPDPLSFEKNKQNNISREKTREEKILRKIIFLSSRFFWNVWSSSFSSFLPLSRNRSPPPPSVTKTKSRMKWSEEGWSVCSLSEKVPSF